MEKFAKGFEGVGEGGSTGGESGLGSAHALPGIVERRRVARFGVVWVASGLWFGAAFGGG